MYLFAIDKKSLNIVRSLILQSEKLSDYIFTATIILHLDMQTKQSLA